ncbi:MAG: DDE-type integrase/transposase/recombinase [Eubacteriales bacterium]|nr:DDE-type integrase/transposase/recombinase [Eubacteriales bacterium]
MLDEQFNPERPNDVWCTDITFILTTDGFVYLNCIKDLYSRKIIVWTLADTLEISSVISTIEKAKASRDTDQPLIIHTDRDCQYVSESWFNATVGITRNYSHTGYSYNNARIESFHSLNKREWLRCFSIRNYRHAYTLIFEYIETFYHTVRIQSHCDYMSLNDYERLYQRVMALPAA